MPDEVQIQDELNEALLRLNELILGKKKALEISRQKTSKARGEAVEKYSMPIEAREFFGPADGDTQRWVNRLFSAHERMSILDEKDMDEVIREKMHGKNPYKVFLTDFLTGLAGPQATTVRERLFAREMKKKELRGQRLSAVSNTLKALGLIDVQRQGHVTSARGQASAIEGQEFTAQAAANLTEQKNINTLAGKGVQSGLNIEQERIKSERDHKESIELAKKRAEVFKTQPVPKSLVRDYPSGYTGPWGDMVQNSVFNARTGRVESVPGAPLRYELTPKQEENRKFANDSYGATLRITKQAAELKTKDPASGAIARVALRNTLVPLLAAVRVTGFELPGFLKKYELGSREGTFLNTFYESVLSKVRAFTGAQVTNQERTYILINTIPRLWGSDETFLLGFEALRLYTGLAKSRVNDLSPNSQGLTPLTEVELDSEGMPIGAATFKDFTSVYEGILSKAEALELANPGAGLAFLKEMAPDATKPLQIEENWEAYTDPSIEAYRQARGQQ